MTQQFVQTGAACEQAPNSVVMQNVLNWQRDRELWLRRKAARAVGQQVRKHQALVNVAMRKAVLS